MFFFVGVKIFALSIQSLTSINSKGDHTVFGSDFCMLPQKWEAKKPKIFKYDACESLYLRYNTFAVANVQIAFLKQKMQ